MKQLHIVFIPFMAQGSMIPTLDMAKLFNSRGVKTTIISTPAFSEPIKRVQESGIDIGLSIIKFPPEGSDLPEKIVSLDKITSPELVPKFVEALTLLQEPVEKLLQELQPNCLISHMFLPWSTDSAAKLKIPRLVFHATNYFARCALEQMRHHTPFKNVSSDSEPFIIPNLPHDIKFVRTQISKTELHESDDAMTKLIMKSREADLKSYGVVVDSFDELEPDYADYYRKVMGMKAWSVGPLLLSNKGDQEKAGRGNKSSIDEHECLSWLNTKKQDSVVYICFGSLVSFSPGQLQELAVGLEESGQDFIWVVKKGRNKGNDDFVPRGFEERTKGKGLVIRGWAPQMMILDHPSIGAFVTHCGWNSTFEGVCAGVPMVTWPMFAEQFYNEKLVTEILRIGVSVGNKQWRLMASEGVGREAVAEAVRGVMVGGDAAEMRKRAKGCKEMARKSVEQGGSSYTDVSNLIQELSAYEGG